MPPKKARSKAGKVKTKEFSNGSSEIMFHVEVAPDLPLPPPLGSHQVDEPTNVFLPPSVTMQIETSGIQEPLHDGVPLPPHVTFSSTNQYHELQSPPLVQGSHNECPPSPSPNQSGVPTSCLQEHSPGAESFQFPGSSNDSSSESELSEPGANHRTSLCPPSRTCGDPRIGHHSTSQAQRLREKKKANDVRTFYASRGQTRSCLFCEEKHAINPSFPLTEYSSKTSTTVLRKHLCECHVDDWIGGCDKLGIKITAKGAQSYVHGYRKQRGEFVPPPQDPESLREKYSQEAFLDALVDFVASEDVSINIIESPKLRAIFLMLREELKDSDIPHRTTLREHIMNVWETHLDALERDMKGALGKVSFTADVWSDPNLAPYMGVTSHWIEAKMITTADGPHYILKLRSELVAFYHIEGRHSGALLADAFVTILQRLNVMEKIGWITLDNASNNDTMMDSLEREFRSRNIMFDKITRRIRCFPHVVNLACQAIISAIGSQFPIHEVEATGTYMDTVKEDPIVCLRVLIRTIRASSLRREAFSRHSREQFVRELQLLRDMEVRWSSTFLMIERAIECKPVIFKFLQQEDFDELRKYDLSEEEWDALEAFLDILSIPHEFQQALSAEKTPTLCDAISHFHAIIEVWREYQHEHPETFDIVQAGIDKLQDYYDRTAHNPSYIMAMLLNPNIKLRWHYQHAPEDVCTVRNTFHQELRPYYRAQQEAQFRNKVSKETSCDSTCQPQTPSRQNQTPRRQNCTPRRRPHTPSHQPPTPSRAGQPSQPPVVPPPKRRKWANRLYKHSRHSDHSSQEGSLRSLTDEIDAYLLDSQVADSSIGFWQANQHRYPTLFAAALDYLAIQGSAVPCERVFSSAKETITMRRNRMGYDLMEALQMLKFTLRNNHFLDFSVGLRREEEILDLENLPNEVLTLVPSPFSQ